MAINYISLEFVSNDIMSNHTITLLWPLVSKSNYSTSLSLGWMSSFYIFQATVTPPIESQLSPDTSSPLGVFLGETSCSVTSYSLHLGPFSLRWDDPVWGPAWERWVTGSGSGPRCCGQVSSTRPWPQVCELSNPVCDLSNPVWGHFLCYHDKITILDIMLASGQLLVVTAAAWSWISQGASHECATVWIL